MSGTGKTAAHRRLIRIGSVVMVGLGLILLAQTLRHGGGLFSIGVLFGVALLGIGAGRLYLSVRASAQRERAQ